jgi:hypothetical protein
MAIAAKRSAIAGGPNISGRWPKYAISEPATDTRAVGTRHPTTGPRIEAVWTTSRPSAPRPVV